MEIKVNSTEFGKKLEQLTKVVATKSVIPILADVLIELRGDALLMTTSDSEIWLSMKCSCTSEGCEMAKFCASAHDLLESIRSLDDADVTMSLDYESHRLTCDYGNGNFSIPFDDAEEFPLSNLGAEEKHEIILDGKKVMNAIEKTVFAVGNSATRPIINGINFNFSENGMKATAADFTRIVLFCDKSAKSENGGVFTLPKKPCGVLQSILGAIEGDIKVSFTASAISFNNADFKMSARLLEGVYPDCDRLLPKNNSISVTIDRHDMLSALKRVLPMTNVKSNLVVLFFEDGQVTLTADNEMFGKSASETVKCDCENDVKIGFNGSLLVDTLRNIDDDNIVIDMLDGTHPALLYASSSFTRDEFVLLLSPCLT